MFTASQPYEAQGDLVILTMQSISRSYRIEEFCVELMLAAKFPYFSPTVVPESVLINVIDIYIYIYIYVEALMLTIALDP